MDQHWVGVQFVADSGRKMGCGPKLSVASGRRAGFAARWLTGRAGLNPGKDGPRGQNREEGISIFFFLFPEFSNGFSKGI